MSGKLRQISVFCAVMMIFCIVSAVAVSAESIYASIESAGISVEIPEEFNVTSADTDVDENVVYNLDAYMNDTSKKLSITAEKNNITENMYNFKYLTKEELEGDIEKIKTGSPNLMGKTFQSVSHAGLKEMPEYILFTLSDSKIQNNITVHYAIAYTLINGELVTIQYSSASGNFNSEDVQIFNQICESIYVTSLYDKPDKVNMPDILKTVATVVIIIGVMIAVTLVIHYLVSRNNARSKEVVRNRRRLSEKYYQSLKKEGIMEAIKIEAEEFINENIANSGNTVIEPSENARPKNPETISAIIEEASTNPTLLEDEWEDIDLTKMFQKPENLSDNDYPTELNAEMIFGGNEKNEKAVPENIHRADSARRYARLFIGDNKPDENIPSESEGEVLPKNLPEHEMSDIEKRHKARHSKTKKKSKGISVFGLFSGNKKKQKKSSSVKSNVKSKSRNAQKKKNTRPKTSVGDTFAEYETDKYWNTYNNND